ncbi:hypothetical protein KDL45_02045 [bacterium]|nr:hypothetical protein [bacterium]
MKKIAFALVVMLTMSFAVAASACPGSDASADASDAKMAKAECADKMATDESTCGDKVDDVAKADEDTEKM